GPGNGLMGGGLGDDFIGALNAEGPHGGPPGFGGPGPGHGGHGFGFGPFGYFNLPSTCTFNATTNRVVCAADTPDGVAVTRPARRRRRGRIAAATSPRCAPTATRPVALRYRCRAGNRRTRQPGQ